MPNELPRPEPPEVASVAVVPIEPYAISVKETAIIENCGRSVVYERLGRGEYTAIKDGARTKVLVESIKRRRATLPQASFKPPRPRRRD